jgi:uncharacterized protein YndB with AHSA1/START domain
MTGQATSDRVRQSVTVPLKPERAFELFVDEFGAWWPKQSHHVGERAAQTAIIEPREGGRWYERDDGGTECEWGKVLAVDRPARILLAWHLSPGFAFDPDPARATEVEVTFVAQGPDSTVVTLGTAASRFTETKRRRCATRWRVRAGGRTCCACTPNRPAPSSV